MDMMHLLATGLEGLATPLRKRRFKHDVCMLSRQNGKVSMDFSMLQAALEKRLGVGRVRLHVMKPEMAGKRAFASGTLEQLRIATASRIIIADGYLPAVCIPAKREGSKVVQMWHAPGAIKKFGYQCVDTPAGRSSQDAREAHMHANYDYIIAGGPGAASAYAEAFGYSEDAIVSLGLPHFDYLLDNSKNSARKVRARQIAADNPFLANGKLNVLYAPTLRKGEGYEGWLSDCVELLAANCPPHEADLIIAGHPLDADFDQSILERFECVHFVPKTATIHLLELADCVISDYSTVALSAGLLDKPVLYYVPDIEAYRLSPGLNVDPLTDERLFASVDAATIMQAAVDRAELARIAQHYHAFTDEYFAGAAPGTTERIADFVMSLLR